MNMIQFEEEHITPLSLAKALNKTPAEVISDLLSNGERGIFSPEILENSVLTWGVVRRACERNGVTPQEISRPEGRETMSKEEWKLLKTAAAEAAGFHRVYGESVRDFTEKVDPAGAKELLEYHIGRAEAIETLIKKVEMKKKPMETPAI